MLTRTLAAPTAIWNSAMLLLQLFVLFPVVTSWEPRSENCTDPPWVKQLPQTEPLWLSSFMASVSTSTSSGFRPSWAPNVRGYDFRGKCTITVPNDKQYPETNREANRETRFARALKSLTVTMPDSNLSCIIELHGFTFATAWSSFGTRKGIIRGT